MPSPQELPLPENSAGILRSVAPVLERFLDLDSFVVGGGSVLAARWRHRRSFDVDLFTTDGEATMAIHRQAEQLRRAVGQHCGDRVSVNTTPRHGEIVLEESGIIEWALAQRLTQRPPVQEVEPLTGMQMDCTEEILAQNLYSRMYLLGGRASRDIYDLAWAVEHEELGILIPAIRCFRSDNGRAMLAVLREMRDGFLAIDDRRPLIDPADPSLEKRAIVVLHANLEDMWPQLIGGCAMRDGPDFRSSGVQWDHVDWLWHHPEHINRRAPSQEEAIALWKVRSGNRLLLESIDTPTDPPPLAHFDLPKHHLRSRDCCDPEHKWLRHEIASTFAGHQPVPDIHRMRDYLVAERLEEFPHSTLFNLFTCISPVGLQQLRLSEGLSMHELVRALHHSGVRRACLARIIEPYADPPMRPAYLDAMEQEAAQSR